MKILAIRLKNLASLAGEQQIDFTAEPLASAGLFAITGPTGAGKSTILDALCLALFGNTPRLEGIATQGKVPDGSDEIGSKDERNLLRRGCASGYAEVDFLGVDGLRYRARWETKRAHERVGGRLQQSSQSLLNLDNDQLLASGKKREFTDLLEQKLGLTLAQFTRAVLLAQSEFSAFLKADDNERGTLLEKLTDTSLYSRLGQAAFEAAKRAREALTRLEQQAEGSQPLEAEPRQALEQQQSAHAADLKALQQGLKELEQQRKWLQELAHLQTELAGAQQQMQAAESERESLAEARRILALYEQLAPQRHRFIRQAELEPLIADIDVTLRRQQDEQTRLQARLDELNAACLHATEQLKHAEQTRQEAEPLLNKARKEEERLAHLNADLAQIRLEAEQAIATYQSGETTLAQLRQQQERSSEQLATVSVQLESSTELQPLCSAWSGYRPRLQQAVQLAARLQNGRAELPGLEQAAQTAETALTEARRALEALQQQLGGETSVGEQLKLLTQQLEDWRKAERDNETLLTLWSQQQQLLARQNQLLTEYRTHQASLESLTLAGKQTRTDHDTAQVKLNTIVQLLERQRLARSENVEALRSSLVPGEPCPVCGSGEHPWHSQAMLDTINQQDEQEVAHARAQLDKLNEQLQALRDQHTSLNAQLRQSQDRQQETRTELEMLASKIATSTPYAELQAQPEAARQHWLEQRLETLKTSSSAASQRQRELLDVQQHNETLRQAEHVAREASAQATRHLEHQRENIDRDSQRLEEELAEFAQLLSGERLAQWRAKPAETFMQLDAQIETRRQQLDQQIALTEDQRQCQLALEREQIQQQHRGEQQNICASRLAERDDQVQNCKLQLAALLGERPDTGRWRQQLEMAVQAARQRQAEVDQQLNDAKGEHIRLSSEQQSCRQRRDELLAERTSLNAELSAWRAAHVGLDDQTLAQLLQMDDSLLAEARERLQQNADSLARCGERLTGCGQRLSAHQAQHPDDFDADGLERAHAERLNDCEQAEQRCAETRAALLADDRRRTQSNELLAQIASASAENQRWGRIATLIGSSDGSGFRKIAQAYNLDLLVQHANAQLRQLARRYRLKRGGSTLGLLVMDTEMGDELRSVHSLSGGETFLVSLALALGLASMASSKLKIESLFIDEGFGSLDPESLQIAMDALDSLQAQGRKVAVISHVAEMHERIPVQIQVQRQGNGQSGLRIIGGMSS